MAAGDRAGPISGFSWCRNARYQKAQQQSADIETMRRRMLREGHWGTARGPARPTTSQNTVPIRPTRKLDIAEFGSFEG